MKGRAKIGVTDDFLAEVGHTRKSYEALSKSGRWSVRNRQKHYAICKLTLAKNPKYYSQRHRKYLLQKNYGISPAEYDALLKDQNYCCAICGTDKPTGRWKAFAVDHNHDTGAVRGLLCNECNRGMGLLKDDINLLRKAAEYLNKHDRKTKAEKNGIPTV